MTPTSSLLAWHCHTLETIKPSILYDLLALRSRVFVVEQACLFQDMDGLDNQCLHLYGLQEGGGVVCAARLVPKGLRYPYASFGRVCVALDKRHQGFAHALVDCAIDQMMKVWGEQPIQIGSQVHLVAFYAQHGFKPIGDRYLEDGIWHVDMMRHVG